MRSLVFLKYIFSIVLIIFGLSHFSHARFCELSHLNQIANKFLSQSSSPGRLALRGDGSSYDDFRRAYNAGRIEGDDRFVSYIDENGKRVPAQVLQIKDNGKVVLRDEQGIVDISIEELDDVRVSETARNYLQSERVRGRNGRGGVSSRVPSSRRLALRGDGSSYDDFRKAYNTGRIEGDDRFVSYIDENGERVPAQVLQIKDNGRVVLRDEQGIVDISIEELDDVRVSETARNYFQSERVRGRNGRGGVSARAPPSRPALRTDVYNRSYQSIENLQRAEQDFERVFDANVIPFTRELRQKTSANRLNPNAWNQVYMSPEGSNYWANHISTSEQALPLQGWKFHISAKPENMHEIAEKMLPFLQREGISHKIVNPKHFDRYVERIGNPNDTQQGKFITVYPRNNEEARKYAQILRQVMEENNFNRDDFINIPNEYEIAPGLFVRYGRLVSGDLKRADGTEIPNTDNDILTPDGRLIEDPRGKSLPQFVQEEMLELFQ